MVSLTSYKAVAWVIKDRMERLWVVLLGTAWLFLAGSCQSPSAGEVPSVLGITSVKLASDEYDLEDIRHSGDLIMLTLYGPETYYEYHGKELGLQFELAERFSKSLGVKLRVEVVKDTVQLLERLHSLSADLVAVEIELTEAQAAEFTACGAYSSSDSTSVGKRSWVVRKGSSQLAKAADEWYRPQFKEQVRLANVARFEAKPTRTSAPILDLKRGRISPYDDLFIRHSRSLGWDWRLLAAQCYQESAFDEKAVSWAGAQGLMQIMPGTARQLGLAASEVFNPNKSVEAAVNYLKQLDANFSDIGHRAERINFVLAAYNGGAGHVRDAMALARKEGRRADVWSEVSQYVLKLREPRYYNDEVVSYGYMRGDETYNYVKSIRSRWDQYRSKVGGRR